VLLGGFGLLAILVLYLIIRKTARIQAPLCDRHRSHWLARQIVAGVATFLALAIGVFAMVAFIAMDTARPRPNYADAVMGLSCVGGIAVFIAWVIAIMISQNTAIRPDEITRTHILLNGVSEDFVNAVEEVEIERRVRLRQWEYEDEAEQSPRRPPIDQPRNRPAPSDGITEERRPLPGPPPDAFES
jgi:hypothetical protein